MTSHTQHCTSVSCKGCVLILHRALQTSIRMLHQCVVINGYVKNTTTTGYFVCFGCFFWLQKWKHTKKPNVQNHQNSSLQPPFVLLYFWPLILFTLFPLHGELCCQSIVCSSKSFNQSAHILCIASPPSE